MMFAKPHKKNNSAITFCFICGSRFLLGKENKRFNVLNYKNKTGFPHLLKHGIQVNTEMLSKSSYEIVCKSYNIGLTYFLKIRTSFLIHSFIHFSHFLVRKANMTLKF